ncbi:MAG: hypothetical protein HZA00_08995 [Nitrospinae bacterium]|nr:hypothetical protein [Nitrospinota bacterium]
MKKLSLLVLITAFVFATGIGDVYAVDIATGGTGNTGAIGIIANSFARQTTALSFTTSANVYVAFAASAATLAEHYSVSAGHLTGDKEYALASSGGSMLYTTRTPAATTITAAPPISTAGVVTSTGWTGM